MTFEKTKSEFLLHRDNALQPENESASITAFGEIEVKTVRLRFDIGCFAMHVGFNDLLLEEEEGTLVLDLKDEYHGERFTF